MPSIRMLCIMMLSFLLSACGGGGSLEKEGSIGDGSGGGTPDQPTYTLTLQGYSKVDGSLSNSVSADAPLDLKATLKKNNLIVAGERITFSLIDEIGELSPLASLTQADGVATVELNAGTEAGAGVATAAYTVDGESYEATFAFQSTGGQGGDSGVSGSTTLSVNITDKIGEKFTEANPVTAINPGTVVATLKKDGIALSDELITFTTNFTGKITPELGTAITNSAGEARVTLSSGNFKGAGQVVATYSQSNSEQLSNTAVFYSSGDSAPTDLAQYAVNVSLLTGCNPGWDNNRDNIALDPTDPNTGCTITNTISSSELGEIFIEVIDEKNEEGVKSALVNTQTNLGSVLPSSGSSLTDNFGIALLKLQPGNTGGAGTISVSSLGVNSSTNFAVGIADLTLEVDNGLNKDNNGNVIPLKAGGSTVIEVTLRDEEGDLYLTPIDVEFSSTCVISNQSVIDPIVKSSGGIATSTYRATGCSIDDDINITVETGGKNFTETTIIPVETSAVQSIQFVNASETYIALPPGEGGAPTQSIVSFKLLDADGIASTQQRIDFKLTDSIGSAKLTSLSGNTDNNGLVQTTVTSGIVPGPLVVKACFVSKEDVANLPAGDDLTCWVDDYELCQAEPTNEICPDGTLRLVPLSEQISSVSSQLTLASGVTDQNSFDASPVTYNTNSLNYNGVTSDITVYFGDQFNNYNGDGVEATILAEAGVIGTSSREETCKTTDAQCIVTWRSQGERPFSDTKWGNRIGEIDGDPTTTEGINPKTGAINCDPYFGVAAPCTNGITRAKNDPNGVVMGGRVSVLAITKGQENFVDEESTATIERRNGLFDIGEYYASYDLPEAFIDHNENASFDKVNCGDANDPANDACSELNSRGGHNETWRDLDNNGIYDAADGKYNGLLCSQDAEAAGECSRELIEVRKQFELVMSGDDPYLRFSVAKTTEITSAPYEVFVPANCANTIAGEFEVSDTNERCDVSAINLSTVNVDNPAYDGTDPSVPEKIDIGLNGITVRIHYTDEFGNPLPAGTTINLSTTNGDLSIIETNDVVPNTNRDTPMFSDVRISREADGNDKFDGVMSITFEFETQTGATKTVRKGIAIFDSK